MIKNILLAAAITAATLTSHAQTPVYQDDSKPVEERITDLMKRMTLEEKIAVLHAQSKFSSHGVPRLGIPELWTSDGPHGIRAEVFWDKWQGAGWTNDSCTAFPALTCLAATWNPDMSAIYGRNIGEEARYRKKDVLLGPGVNIYRTPLNGRNFEYMGEDPYLASQLVGPYIQGVQSNGVAACVKHFALNNQEKNRHTTNAIVSDRALREIYLPAFKAAVDAGVWSVMGSYNLYRNQHGCHNQYLLNDILKGEWAFDGAVISDWGGTHDTMEAITNGLDLEFGTWTDGLGSGKNNAYDSYFLANPYYNLIKEGKMSEKELNDKVRRVLRLMYRTVLDRSRAFGSFHTAEHAAVARQIASEGIVLLKNSGELLPINLDKNPVIAVVGENAIKLMSFGGGSSSLKVKNEVSPLAGLIARIGNQGTVKYARGYVGNTDGIKDNVQSSESRTPQELIAEAVNVARDADYVIFVGGLNKAKHQDCEDRDREGLELPYGQDDVIAALARVNKNLIVVNVSGNAVAMPWVKNVPAIVQAWYSGSEAGNAIAGILMGDVNPSGKLPMTFPASLADVGAHALDTYPGTPREDGSKIVDCNYAEDIYVGYRWADKHGIKPLFPFGHGLSYTKFAYGKPMVDNKTMTAGDKLHVTVNITNKGNRAGAEIVQLYISDLESTLPRPVKELKGFKKVYLEPGESRLVDFEIDRNSLSYYDDTKQQWVCEPGKFEALIGASSADIRGHVPFELVDTDLATKLYPRSHAEDTKGVMSEAYWRKWNDKEQQRIDRDIEQYRKADGEILLADCKSGAEVKIEQVSHDFVFGAHIFNYDQLGNTEANARYRELFGTLFNGATVPFYWKKFEPAPGQFRYNDNDTEEFWNNCKEPYYEAYWRRPSVDRIVEYCQSRGVRIHGHVLVWGNRKWHHPEWMESFLEGDELARYNSMIVERANLENYKDGDTFNDEYNAMTPAQVYTTFPKFIDRMNAAFDNRIRQFAEHYGATIPSWDIVNESTIDYEAGTIIPGNTVCKSLYGIMPGDYPYRALDVAAKAFPAEVALNINDYKMTQGYADECRELLGRGAKIDIIGAQMHLFKPQNCLDIAAGKERQTPTQVRTWMQRLGSVGKPIHLSEITITSPGDDERGRAIQAVVARNLYRLWFSNPMMMGITWWNVVDDCGAPGEPNKSGLFTRDMQPKTAYYALNDLLNKEWRTNITATPDADGTLRFRGFKGNYRITYKTKQGKEKIVEYHLQ